MAATEEGIPPTAEPLQQGEVADVIPHLDQSMPLSVVIFGATGDLAKKKLFPALYQLMLLDQFPRHINIVGYGRRAVVLEEFITKQCAQVKENPKLPFAEYSKCITFHAGGYDEEASYEKLDAKLKEYEAGKPGNRLYFLSVPPTVFGAVSEMIGAKARATEPAFTHLIIEKPFGRDTPTFNELNECTSSLFKESQLFRIDHYLGKEVVLNLMSLRFANQLFEPLWNKEHIESVEINFKEDLGTGGRGGYFDGFGIIRDIMQNHLLQVFMFLAIEPPASTSTAALTKAKEDLLKSVKTLHWDTEKAFIGQFTDSSWTVDGTTHSEPGYLEDPTVPEGSRCPTFASVLLEVENERWAGVPFLMKAGKGLDERMAEVRIHFKPQAYNGLMHAPGSPVPGNELVLRIQPNESCYLKTYSKLPGLEQVGIPNALH
jgi:glucose-6-phosphate 1-dehydrogenase